MIRTYTELMNLNTFEERFEYLKLKGSVGLITFGHERYLNQILYKSKRWLTIRDHVIIRDNGCDLGIVGREIYDQIIVHHMNPILIDDLHDQVELVYDPEFLICTTHSTHNAIHYGDADQLIRLPKAREKYDTVPWKQIEKGRK